MKLIPVLDVIGGLVVRAIGGRRDEYEPIRSVLTDSTSVSEVASAMLAATRSDTLYIADLDVIRWGVSDPNTPDNTALAALTSRILLDCGITCPCPTSPQNIQPVLGLESAQPPERGGYDHGPLGNAFSFDLYDGLLWKNWSGWVSAPDAVLELARRVYGLGFRTWIVLDIGRVGGGGGPGTEAILAKLRGEFPDVELLAGGGVRGWDDVKRLTDAGADGVLVASALHDGTLLKGSIP